MTNHIYEKLLGEISKNGTPSPEDIKNLQNFFIPISASRNSVLEEQDKIPQNLYFINAGFMRLFYYDINGEEQTTFLCSQTSFIASFSSLINQTKATENVECITDCEILKISYVAAKELVEKSELFKNFFLVMFEKSISSATLRANDLAMLNAEQRYQKMIENQPHFIQNIPLQYIASYLGIKPQSLSRIRKQVIK
jgi:CRP/FNR family transcriptional regulator, anaerobic regulatory protein